MARRTKEEADQTRKAILEAAFKVFVANGFARSTLEDVARKAGVTRGAVYWHFRDKAALFVALSEQISAEAGMGGSGLDQRADTLAELGLAVWQYTEVFEKNERYRQFYELVNHRTEWTAELEPILERDRRGLRAAIDSIEKDFEALKEKNEVRADVNSRILAIGLMALAVGLTELWMFDKTLEPPSKTAPRLIGAYLGFWKPPAKESK